MLQALRSVLRQGDGDEALAAASSAALRHESDADELNAWDPEHILTAVLEAPIAPAKRLPICRALVQAGCQCRAAQREDGYG